MERYVLDHFPVCLKFETVVEKLRIVDEEDIAQAKHLFESAKEIARPKAVYRVCYVENMEGDAVTIDNTVFHSAVMAKNLKDIHRVFAYVVTCGTEVDDWSHLEKDYFLSLWLDMIKELILHDMSGQFFSYLEEKYQTGGTSSMNPGSGNADVWPIAQQRPLFDLIGEVGEIGVTLTEGFLMLPTKTVSGILFPSDSGYVNCALCERKACPNRRAPYNSAL